MADARTASSDAGGHARPFWTSTPEALLADLKADRDGLSRADAVERLRQAGPNADAVAAGRSPVRAILKRLIEPLSLILLAAGLVSVATGDVAGQTASCANCKRSLKICGMIRAARDVS